NIVVLNKRAPMTDMRILAALADAMGSDLGFRTPAAARADLDELGSWDGQRPDAPNVADTVFAEAGDGLVLATWRQLLDASSGNDNELAMRATARPVIARVSPATATALGVADVVSVSDGTRRLMLPVLPTAGMVDGVVWVPMNPGIGQGDRLAATPGQAVTVDVVPVDEGAAS
ncbi:MAG: NADH-quinone oxidoreductase subunit G, partial [Tessaracoccus sp.]